MLNHLLFILDLRQFWMKSAVVFLSALNDLKKNSAGFRRNTRVLTITNERLEL